jgi:hypothetical protein
MNHRLHRELRRDSRVLYTGAMRIAWDDTSGDARFMQAKCVDISKNGLRVEAPFTIPARTTVSVNAEQIRLSGAARVKQVVRHGSRFLVGLELNQTVNEEFLEKAGAPAARKVSC